MTKELHLLPWAKTTEMLNLLTGITQAPAVELVDDEEYTGEDGETLAEYKARVASINRIRQQNANEHHKDLVAKGATSKEIASHVASYRRGQMVTKVAEQALVPSYIYNQVFFQEAINTQVSIMRDEDVLPRDRIAAAESVLKYTQVPDSMVGNKSELQEKGLSIIDKLATSMDKLVSMQQEMIESKQLTVLNVAKSKIYEGSYTEVQS